MDRVRSRRVRHHGADAVLIDPGPTPLHQVLGPDIGEVFRQLHGDNGTELRMGVGVERLRAAKRVEQVVLTDGRLEAADAVVVGVGVLPRVGLAANADRVDNGVVVDEYLQSSQAGVFPRVTWPAGTIGMDGSASSTGRAR